ncbi:MAG: hypothetical protein FJ119_09275 [Deltaproteobacteria bacterium]|nr:hypothetical protein [Deltaproteobacteria bacterium]
MRALISYLYPKIGGFFLVFATAVSLSGCVYFLEGVNPPRENWKAEEKDRIRSSRHFARTNVNVTNSLVVKNLDPQKGVDQQTASVLSEIIKNTLSNFCAVQSMDALAAVNSLVEEKLKAGCDDTKCIIEVAGAMDIAQVVTGNISKLGNTYMLSLMLIQTKGENLGVIKRASEECQCTEEELIGMTKRVAAKLMQ